MGEFATKSFFKKRLKEFVESGIEYFEVAPAPDCCQKCERMANKKIMIATATKNDYPPFHRTCRCCIIPLNKDKKEGFLNDLREKYRTGIYPLKRCPHCLQLIDGIAKVCNCCNSEFPETLI